MAAETVSVTQILPSFNGTPQDFEAIAAKLNIGLDIRSVASPGGQGDHTGWLLMAPGVRHQLVRDTFELVSAGATLSEIGLASLRNCLFTMRQGAHSHWPDGSPLARVELSLIGDYEQRLAETLHPEERQPST